MTWHSIVRNSHTTSHPRKTARAHQSSPWCKVPQVDSAMSLAKQEKLRVCELREEKKTPVTSQRIRYDETSWLPYRLTCNDMLPLTAIEMCHTLKTTTTQAQRHIQRKANNLGSISNELCTSQNQLLKLCDKETTSVRPTASQQSRKGTTTSG